MWIERDFFNYLTKGDLTIGLPIRILKGPRQVGKTSLLDHLGTHQLILFDDLGIRTLANENPSLFMDQFTGPMILDEATLAPSLFPEIKKRIDEQRRKSRSQNLPVTLDVWITGSNQTLLQRSVQESLAGRASYYYLNTLSLHEIKEFDEKQVVLRTLFMKGGWPELYVNSELSHVHYLNDFISTFIEKDIVSAAGIEKKAAFIKSLQICSGRVGQLINYSDISKTIGVDLTTVQSWLAILEQNGIVRTVQPYFSNLNQRLIKSPKIYFEDVGLSVRLQGWSEFDPLFVSSYFGSLVENLAFSEISRFFSNRGWPAEIFFLRSKEKVEIDFLIQLPNQRFIAIEVKTTPVDFTSAQLQLLKSIQLNIVEHWVVSPQRSNDFAQSRVILLQDIFENLTRVSI
jgi:predicted AAA+ superfamily ATPase